MNNLALKLHPTLSGLDELAAGLSWKPNEVIAMLWAYFDESGSHASSGLRLTIGGLIAPLSAWQSFEVEWDAALVRRNLRYFHKRDFVGDDAEFVQIIARNIEWVVGFSATPQPHSKESKTYEAYEATLVDCLARVAHLSQAEKVALVFAKHPEFKPTAVQRYAEIVNWSSAQLGPVTFSDPKDVQPLQAADLVTHALRSDEGVRRLKDAGCKVFRFRDGRPVS